MLLFNITIFALSMFFTAVRADICIYNTREVSEKALNFLKNVKHVIYYCPTCVGNNKITEMHLNPKTIIIDDEGVIFADDEEIDIAYIYVPTKDKNIYQNLGRILKCADFSETEVKEYLDAEHPYGIEAVEELQRKLGQCDNNEAYLKVLEKENVSSTEYLASYNSYVTEYGNCLENVFNDAVMQFYPNNISQLKKKFEELLQKTGDYYFSFDKEQQGHKYKTKLQVNRLAEYIISNLLEEMAIRFGELDSNSK